MCVELMTVGALSGLGRTKLCSIISIVFTGARVPLAVALAASPLGLKGIWWATIYGIHGIGFLTLNARPRTGLLRFDRSAPECSLLSLFLKKRSQSVTPHSCQVPKNRVSFIAFLKIFLYLSTLFSRFQAFFLLFFGTWARVKRKKSCAGYCIWFL